jgi:hypothetical protein
VGFASPPHDGFAFSWTSLRYSPSAVDVTPKRTIFDVFIAKKCNRHESHTSEAAGPHLYKSGGEVPAHLPCPVAHLLGAGPRSMGQGFPRGRIFSRGYYERVPIIPYGSRFELDALVGVRLRLGKLPRRSTFPQAPRADKRLNYSAGGIYAMH